MRRLLKQMQYYEVSHKLSLVAVSWQLYWIRGSLCLRSSFRCKQTAQKAGRRSFCCAIYRETASGHNNINNNLVELQITEWLRREGTHGGHLVQSFLLSRLPAITSRWLFETLQWQRLHNPSGEIVPVLSYCHTKKAIKLGFCVLGQILNWNHPCSWFSLQCTLLLCTESFQDPESAIPLLGCYGLPQADKMDECFQSGKKLLWIFSLFLHVYDKKIPRSHNLKFGWHNVVPSGETNVPNVPLLLTPSGVTSN